MNTSTSRSWSLQTRPRSHHQCVLAKTLMRFGAHQGCVCTDYGIRDNGMVEEGLDLPQTALIDKLQTRVGQLLQESYPAVQSRFVAIQPVNLVNRSEEPTGRWRFDICVTPHDKVVLFSRHQTVAYYRQGGNSEPMPADMLMERLRDEWQGK